MREGWRTLHSFLCCSVFLSFNFLCPGRWLMDAWMLDSHWKSPLLCVCVFPPSLSLLPFGQVVSALESNPTARRTQLHHKFEQVIALVEDNIYECCSEAWTCRSRFFSTSHLFFLLTAAFHLVLGKAQPLKNKPSWALIMCTWTLKANKVAENFNLPMTQHAFCSLDLGMQSNLPESIPETWRVWLGYALEGRCRSLEMKLFLDVSAVTGTCDKPWWQS